MNFKTITLFLWIFLIASAAIAGEEHHTRIEIIVDDDAMGDQSFVFDNKNTGFDLHNMVVGETRTLTDRSGSTADIRRTVNGFNIDVAGKTVDLHDLSTAGDMHAKRSIEMLVGDLDSDVVAVEGVKKVKVIRSDNAGGITVISGSEIDPATRERLREALEAFGQDSEIRYIDGSNLDVDADSQVHGRHEVRIIRKEFDETN